VKYLAGSLVSTYPVSD